MLLKNVGNCVVAMVIFVPVGFLNCLQYMSLPVHMKETMLFSFYRYGSWSITILVFDNVCVSILDVVTGSDKSISLMEHGRLCLISFIFVMIEP
jgi:hypothetical protein